MPESPGDPAAHEGLSSALAPVVAEVMREATKRSGKALALALRLEAVVGRSYSDRTVSAWNRGAVMPPADVLLAAAQVTGISLDDRIGVGAKPTSLEREIETMRDEVKAQSRALALLYQRLQDAGISIEGEIGLLDSAEGASG